MLCRCNTISTLCLTFFIDRRAVTSRPVLASGEAKRNTETVCSQPLSESPLLHSSIALTSLARATEENRTGGDRMRLRMRREWGTNKILGLVGAYYICFMCSLTYLVK
jgi:hypothetical protein